MLKVHWISLHFCGIKCSQKMKNIQERALRFVYRDCYVSTYKELLAKCNHNMLYINRIRIIATEDYRALNELSPKYLQDMIEKKTLVIYNLCASSPLTQPKCNTVSYGLNSFRYKGPTYGTLFQTISKKLSLFQNLNFLGWAQMSL